MQHDVTVNEQKDKLTDTTRELIAVFGGISSSTCYQTDVVLCQMAYMSMMIYMYSTKWIYTVTHNYRTPNFKRHNLVDMQFIYINISDNIAEGMLNRCHKIICLLVKYSLLAAV